MRSSMQTPAFILSVFNSGSRLKKRLSSFQREIAAEILGTYVMITLGDASIAQGMFANDSGGFACIAWGISVSMGIYVSLGISGGHLNPAVTLALAVLRDFPWRKVLGYIVGQLVGAFLGACTVYGVYYEAVEKFTKPESVERGRIFATFPQDYLSTGGGVVDQLVGTAFLVLVLFALLDKANASPLPSGAFPVYIGFLVTGVLLSFGFNSGGAINPARDLGPRIFLAMSGWGSEAFATDHNWWWVPTFVTVLGGLVGGALYDLCVFAHHPAKDDKTEILLVNDRARE